MLELDDLTMTQMAKEMAQLTCELARTCQDKEKHFAALYNLTTAEFKCLRLFTLRNSKSIKEIALEMKLTPGRITHILTSLESKKLIERKVDPTDKRNIIVYLTPKSRPFLENINQNHIAIHKDILDKISDDKREFIMNSMKELLKALKHWRESAV